MLIFKFSKVTGTFEIEGTCCAIEDVCGYFRPPVDITYCEGIFTVKVDLPGALPDDIILQVGDREIIIVGVIDRPEKPGPCRLMERPSGEFLRTLNFHVGIVPDKARASLSNGILEITVPAVSVDRDPTRIEIRIDGAD